jgi:hypothetical protein
MAGGTVNLTTGGVGVDTTEFAAFARALRKAEPKLAAGVRVKLREAGDIVARDARDNVDGASAKVADSIRVRVSAATVSVVAGGSGVPMAGLLELGNAGDVGAGKFRHPVFGNTDVWVDQPMHPYLGPAMETGSEAAAQAAIDALDEAIAIVVGE